MLIIDRGENFIIPFQLKTNEGGLVDITSSTVTCNVKETPISSSTVFTKVSTDTAQLEKTLATSGMGIVKVLAANTSGLSLRHYYYEITDATNKIAGFFRIKQNNGTVGTASITNRYESSSTISGSIDGVNATFVLSNTPATNTLFLFVNGVKQMEDVIYTLSGATITFESAYIPQTGDTLEAYYVG